jgi:hypothetical protein
MSSMQPFGSHLIDSKRSGRGNTTRTSSRSHYPLSTRQNRFMTAHTHSPYTPCRARLGKDTISNSQTFSGRSPHLSPHLTYTPPSGQCFFIGLARRRNILPPRVTPSRGIPEHDVINEKSTIDSGLSACGPRNAHSSFFGQPCFGGFAFSGCRLAARTAARVLGV